MKITLNNREETFESDGLTIKEIMSIKNFTFPRVIVKLNGSLIKKEQYTTVQIHDSDHLDIIHLISGG